MTRAISFTAGRVVTYCVHAKASAGVDWLRVQVASNSNANGFRAWFNLQTGEKAAGLTLGTGSFITSDIESLGGGLYRMWIVGKVDSAATAATVLSCSAIDGASATRTASAAYYLGWCQAEMMAASATTGFPSSYIATTSATVTRNADSLSVPYVLGQAGTIIGLYIPYGWGVDQDGTTTFYHWTDNNGGSGNRFGRGNAAASSFIMNDAGGIESSTVLRGTAANTLYHIAHTYGTALTNYFNGANGFAPDTTLTAPFTANTAINIGSTTSGAQSFFGWVALLGWSRVLAPQEVQAVYKNYPVAA